MITLNINGEKRKVKQSKDLNVREYIELVSIGEFDLIDYLAVALGMSRKESENLHVKNPAFLSNHLFGRFQDYSKHPCKGFIVVKGKRYNLNENFTLGQRFIIEENGKKKSNFDLMLFILAVNADYDNHLNLLDSIMNEPASSVLPEAFFLLKNLSNGNNYALKFLNKLRNLTRILKLKSKLVLNR